MSESWGIGSGGIHTRSEDTSFLEQHRPIELSAMMEMLYALMSNTVNTRSSEALEMK